MPLYIGSTSWGKPIKSWDYSAPVANVDFTDLGGYRELLVMGWGIMHSNGVNDSPIFRVSTDNGGNFAATGYTAAGSSSTLAITFTSSVANTSVFILRGIFYNFNDPDLPTFVDMNGGIVSSSGARQTWIDGQHNAIRMLCNGGGNISAGKLRLFAR